MCANANQHDLNCTMKRLVSPVGFDLAIYKTHTEEGTMDDLMISDNDWLVLQQYEGGMEPLNNYSLFSQSAKVVVHYKLFGARRCLELLSSRFSLCVTMYLVTLKPGG